MKQFIKIISIGLTVLATNSGFSQCDPITIPSQSPTNGYGGSFCLEGSADYLDICTSNIFGNFTLLQDIPNAGLQRLELINKATTNSSTLALKAFNPVGSKFDVSFDFYSAGSAKIRSYRGGSNNTFLQFMTQSASGTEPVQRMHINDDGKIGIGTDAPTHLLDVKGTAAFGDPSYQAPIEAVVIKGPNLPLGSMSRRDITFDFQYAGKAMIRSYRGDSYDTFLQFLTTAAAGGDPAVRMHVDGTGNIGIGTVTPKAKLEVLGNAIIGTVPSNKMPVGYNLYVEKGIMAEKVKVALLTSTNWADHVFNKDYKLLPLSEVESFINKNNHLPGIPSADELVKEGIDVGAMLAKQTEKIEELTLYIIEMKKEIELLKKERQENSKSKQ